MRAETTIQVVPAREVVVTTYSCDECDFKSGTAGGAAYHHAERHACRQRIELEDKFFYRFQTKEDLDVWLEHYYARDIRKSIWEGPGWYALSTWRDHDRDDNYVLARSAAAWADSKISKAQDVIASVTTMLDGLEKADVAAKEVVP